MGQKEYLYSENVVFCAAASKLPIENITYHQSLTEAHYNI